MTILADYTLYHENMVYGAITGVHWLTAIC